MSGSRPNGQLSRQSQDTFTTPFPAHLPGVLIKINRKKNKTKQKTSQKGEKNF